MKRQQAVRRGNVALIVSQGRPALEPSRRASGHRAARKQLCHHDLATYDADSGSPLASVVCRPDGDDDEHRFVHRASELCIPERFSWSSVHAIAFCLCSALLTGCYLFIPMDAWLLAALGLPVGMSMNGAFAGIGPMLSELFPTQIRTTCMGFSYNVGKSLGALSVALVGAVAEITGLMGSIALFCFIGYFCAFWPWRSCRRRAGGISRLLPRAKTRLIRCTCWNRQALLGDSALDGEVVPRARYLEREDFVDFGFAHVVDIGGTHE